MAHAVYPQSYPQERCFLEMPFARNGYEKEFDASFQVI